MEALETLKSEFISGEVLSQENEPLKFLGEINCDSQSVEALEFKIGRKLPLNISSFLKTFGGTKIYLDEFGLGLRVLKVSEIHAHNLEQEKTTDSYWPIFIIIAYTPCDDMLILYTGEKITRFGILDHEAWGEPSCWLNEAISWLNFDDWLENFVITKGEALS